MRQLDRIMDRLLKFLKSVLRWLGRPVFPLLGERHLWQSVQSHRRRTVDPATGIRSLQERFALPDPPPANRPVFVFAPTWRSGSTLVQRLVNSSGEVWMWGEVYTRCNQFRQLSAVFQSTHEGYPFPDIFPDDRGSEPPSSSWVANLSPDPSHLIAAHRRYWDRLLAEPVRSRGIDRWGFKEVQLSADHAAYMKALYPDARVVVLIRDPYAAWLSYYRWRNWYAQYPDEPVVTVSHFGRLWQTRTEGFLEAADDLDALVLRYEDVIDAGDALRRLERHVGISVDRSVLDEKVGSAETETPGEKRRHTGFLERMALRRAVEPAASRLGYEPK